MQNLLLLFLDKSDLEETIIFLFPVIIRNFLLSFYLLIHTDCPWRQENGVGAVI